MHPSDAPNPPRPPGPAERVAPPTPPTPVTPGHAGEAAARVAEGLAIEEAQAAAASAHGERHDAYAALRNANYRRFAAGFLCSSTGLRMMGAAVIWEVYERTGSAFALGLVGLVRAIPVLVLALPAGHVIDLLDRRRMLAGTQAGFAAVMAGLALVSAGDGPMWSLYALLFLSGCVRVFNGPARAVILPAIVPDRAFSNAVTWNSGAFQFSALAGPLMTGGLIWASESAWPVYALAAAGCGVFAVTALGIRLPAVRTAAGAAGARFSFDGMFQGARHIWREPTVLAAITLDLLAVFLGGATALMPVYAKMLDVGPVGLGALNAAPYAGALAMALALPHFPPFARAGRALLWSVAGFGACMAVFGLSPFFWLSVFALAASGAFDNISVVIRHVLVQVRTPEHLRGRVSSVNSVFIESSNELGSFQSGVAGAWLGPVAAVVSGGVGAMLVAAGAAWAWPALRQLGRLDRLAAPDQPPVAPAPPAPAAPAAP